VVAAVNVPQDVTPLSAALSDVPEPCFAAISMTLTVSAFAADPAATTRHESAVGAHHP
jgi:hypothetical protein